MTVYQPIVYQPAQTHSEGHFGDESFQAITCTGTGNRTQNKQEKIHRKQQK